MSGRNEVLESFEGTGGHQQEQQHWDAVHGVAEREDRPKSGKCGKPLQADRPARNGTPTDWRKCHKYDCCQKRPSGPATYSADHGWAI
jgi:hypothetical protein